MRNPLAVTFQVLAVVALVAAVLFVFFYFEGDKSSSNKLLYALACVVDGLFMYGFAYVIEAASIYIEKDKKERKKNYQY